MSLEGWPGLSSITARMVQLICALCRLTQKPCCVPHVPTVHVKAKTAQMLCIINGNIKVSTALMHQICQFNRPSWCARFFESLAHVIAL